MATLIRIGRNGTKYYEGYTTCSRCGGEGIYYIGVLNGKPLPSHVDGGICFECGGSGKVLGKWKEYTPEHEAKLKEQRRKRAEKRAAEQAQKLKEIEAQRQAEEERLKAEEEREKAEKAKSCYIGEEGQKIEEKAVYKFSAWYESRDFSGFGTQTNYIHTFKIGDDTVVWKTTKPLGLEKETAVTLRGTVKAHNEYRDEKQTILTRCKVTA